MALNLNKGGEENSKPFTEKKGLNLSKSGDALKKEETVFKDPVFAKSGANERSPKKKKPVMFILLAGLILGGGLFWFMNKSTTNLEQASNMNGGNKVSSAPAQIEGTATPDNTANNQGQDNSVNPSTVTSSDISVSNSSERDVSVSSDNLNNPNNVEDSNTTASKNQFDPSNSAPSDIMPIESIDEKVIQVLRGDYGNGLERKRALGNDYAVIQAKVNEIYKIKYK